MNQQGEGPKNTTWLQKGIIELLGEPRSGGPDVPFWGCDAILRCSSPLKRQDPCCAELPFKLLLGCWTLNQCLEEEKDNSIHAITTVL